MALRRQRRLVWLLLGLVSLILVAFLGERALRSSEEDRRARPSPTGVGRAKDLGAGSEDQPSLLNQDAEAGAGELCSVTGRVLTVTGIPLPGAVVRDDAGRTTASRLDGLFMLGTEAASRITISADGYGEARRILPASPTGTVDLGEIRLAGSATVRVEVLDSQGGATGGAQVAWAAARPSRGVLNPRITPYVDEKSWTACGTTTDEGILECRGVPLGRPLLWRATLRDGTPLVVGPHAVARAAGEVVRIRSGVLHTLEIESRYRDGTPIGPVWVTAVGGPPWARWRQAFPNDSGTLRLQLPQGEYRVAVLAAGRFLREQAVALDQPRRVDLGFDARTRIIVHANDEKGRPVPRFVVARLQGDPGLPLLHGHVLFGEGSTWDGRDGTAELVLALRVDDPSANVDRQTLLVRAPGFAVARTTVRWTPDVEEQHVTVRLARGVTIRGVGRGLPTGAEVRLYYRRDPGGAAWTPETAPLVDSARAGAKGSFLLQGFGEGRYEVRVAGPLMEIPLGELDAPGGEVIFEGEYRPATLRIQVESSKGAQQPTPVLAPLVPGNKWNPGERTATLHYEGTREGSWVSFTPLAPGRYHVICRPGGPWEAVSDMDGARLSLAPREIREISWTPPRPPVWIAFMLSLPQGMAPGGLMFGALPKRQAPVFAAELSWSPVGRDGRGRVAAAAGEPVYLLFSSSYAGPSEGPAQLGIAIMGVIDVPAPEEAGNLRVSLDRPGAVVVTCENISTGMVELHAEALRGVLRDRILTRAGRTRGGLVPGRYRVTVTETGIPRGKVPRRAEVATVITDGATTEVHVAVR